MGGDGRLECQSTSEQVQQGAFQEILPEVYENWGRKEFERSVEIHTYICSIVRFVMGKQCC